MHDEYNLRRFIEAQEQSPGYESVVNELRSGQKCGCWMWYIFPQIKGLGQTPISQKYAISSLEEAQKYLEHPILGSRLRECTQLVMKVDGRSAEQIFNYPDYLKFRSSMTLFACSMPDNSIFQDALFKYFAGQSDPLTLAILKKP